jgi:glycosyltransferase involved in cell wall biosynthesis
MKILYISTIRKGGPYHVLKDLENHFKKNNEVRFEASLKGYILAFFTRKYDIIHSALPIPFNIFAKKRIFHIHGNFRKERGLKNPLGYLYPLTIRTTNNILFPSHFLKKKLNIKKGKVISNIIDDRKFSNYKKNFDIKKEVKLIILTKFHFYDKARGIIDLVSILKDITINKKIILNIYGDGRFKDIIEKKVKQYNNKKLEINFKGFQKNIEKEITKHDIFTYYSHLDTFALVLLEAMNLKMPIITNEFGAAKEISKNNNSIEISKSKKDYGEKLLKLIKSKSLREKTAEKGFKNAKENFSKEKIIKEYEKYYREILR